MEKFSSIIKSGKPVLVDFFAEWCGPCKTMAPILSDVKKQLGDKAVIIKIDIDKNPNAAAFYQIKSVPTLMLFKNGNVLWKQSGVIQQTELINLINSHQ